MGCLSLLLSREEREHLGVALTPIRPAPQGTDSVSACGACEHLTGFHAWSPQGRKPEAGTWK